MTSLGTTAYVGNLHYENLIPHPSVATPTLQNVCTQGDTTTTHINMNGGDLILSTGDVEATLGKVTAGSDISSTAGNIDSAGTLTAGTGITSTTGDIEAVAGKLLATHCETTGHIEAGTHLQAGSHVIATTYIKADTNITATTGDITATAGKVTAGSGITNQTGDIVSEVGRLSVGTSGNPTSATGNIINYGSGDIICEQGHIRAHTYIKADTGDITATAGDIKTLAGNIDSAGNISGINVTATTGDIECSAGDISAPSGGFSCGSSSLLNRLRYNTYYGSVSGNPTSASNPYQLSGFGIWNPVNIPAGYYNCVLFCKGNPTQTQYQFEFTTNMMDVLKDYTIKVHLQPAYDPTSSNNTGVQEVRIGYMSPNSYQFKAQVDASVGYATNQILKFSFHFEYSPMP